MDTMEHEEIGRGSIEAQAPGALKTPLAIALAYTAFGMAWILLSDRLLQAVATDTATLSTLGQGKGIAFVLVTAALVYMVAARRQAGDAANAAIPQDRPGRLMWVFALACAVIVLAGLVTQSGSAQRAVDHQVAQLRREAEMKAQIAQGWLERRTDEAHALSADAALRTSLLRWRQNPDEASTAQLRKQLQVLLASAGYADALLLDGHANLLLSADGGTPEIDAQLADDVRAAFSRGMVSSSDFQARAGDPTSLRFDLFLPILNAQGRPEAVLVLRTAPRRTLLPQLLAGTAIGTPDTLLLRPNALGVMVIGLGASDTPAVHPADSPAASLASLAQDPSLTGRLVDGLPRGDEPNTAIAMPLRQSGWYVAMQTPRSKLHGEGAADAATLAVVNVLAVLTAGGFVYAALQRRERRAAARQAAERQEKERAWKIAEAIANSSTDTIFAKDLQGRYLFVNRELCRALGRSPEQLLGSDSRALYPAEQVRRLIEDDAAVLRSDKPICIETRLSMASGDRIYSCAKGRLVDDKGDVIGVYGISSDVTARRDMQQRMRQWATAFGDIRDGVVVTDALGHIQSVNRAFTQITGYSAEEATGSSMKLLHSGRHSQAFYEQMWALLAQTGHWQGEIWNRRKCGEIYPEWLTISAVREDDGKVTHYVGVFTDISRIKDSEAHADWLVHNDPLTKLPNRAQLQRHLEKALARSRRRESRAVLMVIDLDGFKTVNDSLGHPAGDELLVCVADRLKARLRHRDFLGRLGGDEFLLILESSLHADGVTAIARDLLDTISAPFALSGGRDAYLTASIGISLFPDDGCPTAVELLRDADAAMYRAKELGRNRFCFYTGDMNQQAMAKLEIEAALSRAIERDELLLHYQPKVDGRSGKVTGAEALLRWHRAGIGLVPPGQFIPLAEHSSLILDIGAWVIDAACRQIRAWMDAGQPVVRIAVNVAARQFAAGDLDAVVADALQRHGVPARHLELELTEGMLITNPQGGTAMLQRLRDLGVKVSLDDFGTGYSSLAYLQQLPIDTLKIDQSFVRRIGEVPDGEALVDAVIGLAHRLRLRVVAEGVESAAQRDHLLSQGCDEMQGYYFGRPDTAESLQRMLVSDSPMALTA